MGSNIAPEQNVEQALVFLRKQFEVLAVSALERTAPIGIKEQADFLNGAVLLRTDMNLSELEPWLKQLEDVMGRDRTVARFGPRVIDLDVVVWNGRVVDPDFFKRDFLQRAVAQLLGEQFSAVAALPGGLARPEDAGRTREELLEELQHTRSMLEHFFLENEEQINFSWTGNLGHWYWDVKNNEVRFNKLKALALGYTKEELPEKIDYQFFTDKLHPDDYEGVMQNMRDHMMGLTGVYEVEYRIRTKEGRWKWFYDRGKVTRRAADGKPLFLAGIVFDITLQKEQEAALYEQGQQLKLALAERDKLMSIVAHDLKAPFNALIGLSELLLDEEKQRDPEKVARYAKMINEGAESAYALLLNLLEWSRMQTGRLPYRPGPQVLETVIQEVLSPLEAQAVVKGIRIRVQVGQFRVWADQDMLATILRNLISNAIKFTRRDGFIQIEAFSQEQEVVVTVSDNGLGIEEERRLQLFETGEKTSILGTDNEKGTGLGLPLCRELVEKHGGRIWVESEEGKGSTFSFSLPLPSS